ncbi:MAG: hypothetical protein Q8Q81_02835, partial [Oxalobacteraceae bacterium]|nr:hypothetical protein [Oxalobacteraceae bacterium]
PFPAVFSEGADAMAGGLGNDIFMVDDAGDVASELAGEGTDTVQSYLVNYTLAANVENLQLMGAQNLNATGNSLNNVLTGNSANNTLTGGTGSDRFVFNTALDATNLDTVTDFSRTQGDTLMLDDAVFAALVGKTSLADHFRLSTQAAVGGDDFVVYNAATGQLFYDATGTGTGQLFATLGNKPQDLTGAQFVVI